MPCIDCGIISIGKCFNKFWSVQWLFRATRVIITWLLSTTRKCAAHKLFLMCQCVYYTETEGLHINRSPLKTDVRWNMRTWKKGTGYNFSSFSNSQISLCATFWFVNMIRAPCCLVNDVMVISFMIQNIILADVVYCILECGQPIGIIMTLTNDQHL